MPFTNGCCVDGGGRGGGGRDKTCVKVGGIVKVDKVHNGDGGSSGKQQRERVPQCGRVRGRG